MSEITTEVSEPQKKYKHEYDRLIEDLSEPFDTDLLYWKPQATNKDKTRAMAAVYADPRAYIDRLNEACGMNGWEDRGEFKQVGDKLVATVTVTILALGVSHTDIGEEPVGDQNAATAAWSQAFKRACVKFGVGRYLYEFPKGRWYAYDAVKKQISETPEIPDWAQPRKRCVDCSNIVAPYVFETKEGTKEVSVQKVLETSRIRYGQNICGECQRKRTDKVKEASGDRLK